MKNYARLENTTFARIPQKIFVVFFFSSLDFFSSFGTHSSFGTLDFLSFVFKKLLDKNFLKSYTSR